MIREFYMALYREGRTEYGFIALFLTFTFKELNYEREQISG